MCHILDQPEHNKPGEIQWQCERERDNRKSESLIGRRRCDEWGHDHQVERDQASEYPIADIYQPRRG
jgi:hypothetical protein